MLMVPNLRDALRNEVPLWEGKSLAELYEYIFFSLMNFSNNVSAAFSPGLHGQIFEPGNLIFLINFSKTESDEFIVLISLSSLSIS